MSLDRTTARRGLGAILLLAILPTSFVLGQDPNACDEAGDSPDVIVGNIDEVAHWGTVGEISGYSIGTVSCNVGTCWLNWFSSTNQHPVIGQNMFRLEDGRFEQIGQSWLKHGFYALSDRLCSQDCISTDGTHLGVNCSDPYWAGLNGSQPGLGPKFEVDAARGDFPYPATDLNATGDAIYKRLQVRDADLDPALHPDASYFVEGQYVTPDDATAGNALNNASWRPIAITTTEPPFLASMLESTRREQPAIHAWLEQDPQVQIHTFDVPGDGRFLVGSRAVPLGAGYWAYEYAVQNLNSTRAAGGFRVAVPGTAELLAIGFHDVDYHSGEPFDGGDWSSAVEVGADGGRELVWTTTPYAVNRDANALRWGTLYNFRFVADVAPAGGGSSITLDLFRPGSPAEITVGAVTPLLCDADGLCEAGETCGNCAVDCLQPGPLSGLCGNGVCEPGAAEDCTTCPGDCAGVQSGNPGNRYCCGAGGGDSPIDCSDPRCSAGAFECGDDLTLACCGDAVCEGDESPCSCEVDCGTCLIACDLPGDCDDGLFCNGDELCTGNQCAAGADPCPGAVCDEAVDSCLDCIIDANCDDGDPCTGVESCQGNGCFAGTPPCPGSQCDPVSGECAECLVDAHCDDGSFCNGLESCSGDVCLSGGGNPCGEDYCDEATDSCIACNADCDDGEFCNGAEICVGDGCLPAASPCGGLFCDEERDLCLGAVAPQPRQGRPLHGLDSAQRASFDDGRLAFERAFVEAEGLGPAFNGAACTSCHASADDLSGTTGATWFGRYDMIADLFDPLDSLGGPLLQELAVSPSCAETLPPQADVIETRRTTSLLGLGLIEAIPDATLQANEAAPPGGVSGRTHSILPLEEPAQKRVGRFGWKAQQATLRSTLAEAAVDHLGLTSSLLPAEHAPGGDDLLLQSCDGTGDPEDLPGAGGTTWLERVGDYLRYLAPPPQTPRSGLQGELHFFSLGCANCHVGLLEIPDDPAIDPLLRDRTIKPYSDFLLHDMGSAGEQTVQGGAARHEVRTPPLWGLRQRTQLWHDASISGGSFTDRIEAAILTHDDPDGEAQPAAQAYFTSPQVVRDQLVAFLDSLGRLEFDHDGDGDVDSADHASFVACFSGPGSVYGPADPCSLSDIDQDGDVDQDDYDGFLAAFDGEIGGRVADGAAVPGEPLRVDKTGDGRLVLSWDPSCHAADDDYHLYSGPLSAIGQHSPLLCGTGGSTSTTIDPPAGDRYFLVVPAGALREGSYGSGTGGIARQPAGDGSSCLPQAIESCL